jgi:curli biogenesis system outer membrane secretion channel CsgG
MRKSIAVYFLAFAALLAQAPKPPAPAAPTTTARRPAANNASSGVDTIVELKKGGLSDSLIIKTIQSAGKAYQLSPADMLKLQKAGVSESIIELMMNPNAAPAAPVSAAAAVRTPEPAQAPVSQAGATPYPPDLPGVQPGVRKRRIAVTPFDYAAVATWVQYWFHNDVNIGQGIRAMLTARMGQAKNIVLVEREKMNVIQSELNLNKTGAVNQGTKVKTGKMSGADCILLGDIVIFGRDDKSQSDHESGYGQVGRMIGSRMPGLGRQVTAMGSFSKEEKAVVAIALRIVDTETSEVLETAEARGESSRSSKNWTSFTAGGGTYQSNSGAMTSSNFEATIIGEATSAAVDKIIALLDQRVPQMPLRSRSVEGRVAKVSGNSPILGFGANEGVALGDRFDILKIMSQVVDPTTHQVLDVETAKVGELVASNVRDQITTGNYGGEPLSETYVNGYMARLVVH